MVRFIIHIFHSNSADFHIIYIPLWLDLLLKSWWRISNTKSDLHSTMVRFIIATIQDILIYLIQIYIPLWLDLLSVPLLA